MFRSAVSNIRAKLYSVGTGNLVATCMLHGYYERSGSYEQNLDHKHETTTKSDLVKSGLQYGLAGLVFSALIPAELPLYFSFMVSGYIQGKMYRTHSLNVDVTHKKEE